MKGFFPFFIEERLKMQRVQFLFFFDKLSNKDTCLFRPYQSEYELPLTD